MKRLLFEFGGDRANCCRMMVLLLAGLFLAMAMACGESESKSTRPGDTTPDVGADTSSEDVATCSDEEELCDGVCVEILVSDQNCGTCGTTCGSEETCEAGACVLNCVGGQVACDGVCRDFQTDRESCGACGVVCENGEVCSAGSCELSCGSGLSECDGVCRDLPTDRNNCGGCGVVCGDGEVCSNGSCEVTCGGGLTDCGGVCRDQQTDRNNCGACGEVCESGEVCSEGACEITCGGGLEECEGVCRDLDNDRFNCGGCGDVCEPGEVCTEGGCEVSCGGDLAECGGACRDLTTDRLNCGECGTTCGAGQVCSNGSCEVSCDDELTECSGVCRDLTTDRNNCGGCGDICEAGEVCSAGSCEVSCGGGLTECGGVCRDLSTDFNNCGGCGDVCASGQLCLDGSCEVTCGSGLTSCDGVCRDLATDRNNCGGCGDVCASGEVCNGSICELSCGGSLVDCSGVCRDLSTDTNNCGGCGDVCAPGELCSGGVCTTSCGGGLTNCGGTCSNTNYDPNHCGTCDASCAAADNAVPTCGLGNCGYVCEQGWGDCDGLSNGCETDVTATLEHCGACGNECTSGPNSTPLCTVSVCDLACDAGYTFCGDDVSDGCTDTDRDVDNCGGCGTVCPSNSFCEDGGCVTLGGSGTVNDPIRTVPPRASCQTYLDEFGQLAIDGVYTLEINDSSFDVYCDQTTEGGGWTMLAKIAGANGEGWRWNSDAWSGTSSFGEVCVTNTDAGCDGKSEAFYGLVVSQVMVDTGLAGDSVAGYDLTRVDRTLRDFYSSNHCFDCPSNGVVIGNRFFGAGAGNFAVIAKGDGDGESYTASSGDRCMFHVRATTGYTGGYCAGRWRGGTTFVSHPTSISTNNRADYAQMHNGGSPTYGETMVIYGR